MPRFKNVNGIRIQLTAEEETARDIEVANELAYQQANEYKIKRQDEYPPIGDQLDYIYHNGVEQWKTDIITPIKERYPKP